jgi:DNA-binding CsgD family transcriptional regulator
MYREAGRHGREPQPGLSLLRLAEGKADVAVAALRGVLDPAGGLQGPRPKLLGPYVEILIAAGDLDAARGAADELTRIATAMDAPLLLATSAQAAGAVLLAEGSLKAALARLREAWTIWQQLETPYEVARARALLGQVCRQLDDHETARTHVDAARSAFGQLGAAPDLALLERQTSRDGSPPGALTDREREVLSLVAIGRTNRQIAAALRISEHTVARHLSNIFDKLAVTSRTAASAFAHRHNLL